MKSIKNFNDSNKLDKKHLMTPAIAVGSLTTGATKNSLGTLPNPHLKFPAPAPTSTNPEILMDYANTGGKSAEHYACIWVKKSSVNWKDAGVIDAYPATKIELGFEV